MDLVQFYMWAQTQQHVFLAVYLPTGTKMTICGIQYRVVPLRKDSDTSWYLVHVLGFACIH